MTKVALNTTFGDILDDTGEESVGFIGLDSRLRAQYGNLALGLQIPIKKSSTSMLYIRQGSSLYIVNLLFRRYTVLLRRGSRYHRNVT